MANGSDYLLALYDAALSDQHWPRALDLFSREIGSVGAILVALDKVGLPFHIQQATSNYGLDRVQHYFDNYGHFDEPVVSQTLAKTPPFKLLKDKDVWGDMTVIEQRPDYRWGREQMGLRRRAGVRLSSNKGWMDLLALQFDRDWPEISPALQEQLNFILPHMAKVVEINRQFSILRERYRAVLSALDHVASGPACFPPKATSWSRMWRRDASLISTTVLGSRGPAASQASPRQRRSSLRSTSPQSPRPPAAKAGSTRPWCSPSGAAAADRS